jgi:hypothetical protein
MVRLGKLSARNYGSPLSVVVAQLANGELRGVNITYDDANNSCEQLRIY